MSIVRTAAPGLPAWRKKLFIAMWRNQAGPSAYFGLPEEQTVTMASLIEL
jgi:K+ transporter